MTTTRVLVVDEIGAYSCCFHCSCPTRDGHPVPCARCSQSLRLTRDRLTALAMNRDSSLGGGVNADRISPAKDAPTDGRQLPSGVPAPPPHVSWSDPADREPVNERPWWEPRPAEVSA